jgi:hypothetical protein
MRLSVTTARLCYLLGAVAFALIAVAITRARADLLDPRFLVDVLSPTIAVSLVACFFVVGPARVASFPIWLLAGVLVPIGSVVGYLVPVHLAADFRVNELLWFEIVVASLITVPVGLVGHLVLWLLMRRRFSSSVRGSERSVA